MRRRLIVEGMSCMNCVKNVHDALMAIEGVTAVNIDIKTKTAFLNSMHIIDDLKIKNTVSDIGYAVTEIEKV